MRRHTGLILVGVAVLTTACGPRRSEFAPQPDSAALEITSTTVVAPSPSESAVTGVTPGKGDEVVPTAESAGTPATVASAPVDESSTTATTTTTTAARPDIDVPDLAELDALLADVESILSEIDLTQTEGDLP